MSASAPPLVNPRAKLPELFGRETVLLGWQGITFHMPRDWNLASFGGDSSKGNFRIADDEGIRVEVAWEQPRGTPDVARSVDLLLQGIAREAKRKKNSFQKVENPKLISRARQEDSQKEQLTSFGWVGDREQPVAHGSGAAWHCEQSGRVVVLHFLGRGTESPDRTRRMAGEILSSSCSHSHGGWQTWSVFDLQLEVPEEFKLVSAKLQTGRLELDWERIKPPDTFAFLSPKKWGLRPERIALRRISAANVVLEHEDLPAWARRVAVNAYKAYRFPKVANEGGHFGDGLFYDGVLRDLRREIRARVFDFVLRRRNPPPRLDVWHDKGANKIFGVLSDLHTGNTHVRNDVLDSIVTE